MLPKMKKLLPLFLLLLGTGIISMSAQTRKVTLAEYFIDIDPGQGLAIPLDAADGNFNDVFEQVIKNGISLTAGNHTINIRVKDVAGNWSPVFSSAITVEALRTIQLTQAEYFIDTDPGQGNGAVMLAIDGNFNDALEQTFANGISLTAGNHTINIRVKDAAGNWSPVFSSAISVETLRTIQLTQAEYFIDTDPGQGNGSVMLVIDGNFNDALEQVFANGISLTAGNHTINIRVKDAAGNWSPIFSSAISVEALRTFQLTQAEYFIDTDPGQGNGYVMLAIDGNFDEALEQVFANGISLTSGNHTINIRVKDAAGNWSPVFSSAITVETLRTIQISLAEYFWDADPGEGNGTLMIAIDGNYDDAFEKISASGIITLTGVHKLSIRIRDAQGNWSPPFSSVIADENYCNNPAAITECPSVLPVNSTAGQCGAFVNYSAAVVSGTPNPIVTYSQISGTFFPVGTTIVNVTAINFCATATCSFEVIVIADIEICNNGIDDDCDFQIDEGCSVTLNIKMFIEGYYIGGNNMNAAVDPINYPTLCDTVVVELHDETSPFNLAHSIKSVIDITGNGQFIFPSTVLNGTFYIVIKHRNSIETWSKFPVFFNTQQVSFDFTSE